MIGIVCKWNEEQWALAFVGKESPKTFRDAAIVRRDYLKEHNGIDPIKSTNPEGDARDKNYEAVKKLSKILENAWPEKMEEENT